jgi:2-polyprenyl-6-methoxyphenol hydroxylase-like FAD-dependent oxidoreductase
MISNISNALIIGGGIGGMAAAISLAKRGVSVELIDIDPEWRVYGAGITITGPTLRAYRHLDMVDDIAQKGAITNGSRIFRFDGLHLQDLDEPLIEADLPATGGILRPVLHQLMRDQVEALPIKTRLGLTVTALENREGGVAACFSDGSTSDYDLVIGADSIQSVVRKLAFPYMQEPERTGQGCWRISMQRPPEFERGEFYFGHHRNIAGITRCGAESVYLWMLTPHEHRETHFDDEELFTTMKANLADFGGNAGWIRDNMQRSDWINYRPLEAKIQPRPWSQGRIVLVGDSVHATTPHLASGAGMAVESAIVLAQELETAMSVEAGLAAYEERRFERCRDIVESSIAIGNAQLGGAGPDVVGGLIGAALHRFAAPF